METTIRKWGNSLAVRLPKHVAKKLALREGSRVQMRERTADVVISPAGQKHLSRKEMLRTVTPENRHSEIDFFMHAAEPSFSFWDNPDDTIYDAL